jgi:hypothetical protein
MMKLGYGYTVDFEFRSSSAFLSHSFSHCVNIFLLSIHTITSRGACSPRTAVIRGAFMYTADGYIILPRITRHSISSYLTDPAEHCAGGGGASGVKTGDRGVLRGSGSEALSCLRSSTDVTYCFYITSLMTPSKENDGG